MSYAIKEMFYTLQGEGARAGRPAVFCRFAGCNLWSGREEDRAQARCTFCDTDFVGVDGAGGGRFEDADDLAHAIERLWPTPAETEKAGGRYVVLTGGEPTLQIDAALIDALHARHFEIALETNATRVPPPGIDWICASPKGDAPLAVGAGDELKLVYPQPGVDPAAFADLDFTHFFLQPMDGPERARNTALTVRYCLDHPCWKLSLQTHKIIGIP
ncbi:7-carboxy-7-deazaguanine synthase [Varunaivibrio sulfuroxidans]|uniref:7-carboxy-7-deazaguanine synthase n=1 Tax=Varunaivibrio sulfuroxidans TaxID=1773489 RepID=A0A4R3JI76_9PROT|nr:7-carboxy-7-deazaguanine synthase [Varunaivibrio sulfuroxidans]TCS65083.1 7-carboxy-7-deazaguanine synthase (Cx14CxxC type) [Varunaivibrio sulfuroxidans]WES29630.1 7-carboxy-7-deazaguanine synthase [Varunaivibrio sulfuroxidans]